MTTQEMHNAALNLIEEHNQAIGGEGKPGFVPGEDFIAKIKLIGGTTPEDLKSLSYEQVSKCMPEYEGLRPEALAKKIARIWRGKEEVPTSRPISSKHADRMTLEELIEHFASDPADYDSPVGERLRKASKGQSFIVYSSGRSVDIEATKKLLRELKDGYPARDHYNSKAVYAVGNLPDNYAEENPLYINRPLRPDGTCDQLNRSWEGVNKSIRQFIRVALNENELNVTSEGGRDRAHDILDKALAENAMQKLRERYPMAAIKFDALEKTNSLPNLLIPLNGSDIQKKGTIAIGSQVVWTHDPKSMNYRANQTVWTQTKSVNYRNDQ